jgi:hypothetical protein
MVAGLVHNQESRRIGLDRAVKIEIVVKLLGRGFVRDAIEETQRAEPHRQRGRRCDTRRHWRGVFVARRGRRLSELLPAAWAGDDRDQCSQCRYAEQLLK